MQIQCYAYFTAIKTYLLTLLISYHQTPSITGKGLVSFIFVHPSQRQALNKSILSQSHISQVESKTKMFSRFRVLKGSP